MSAYACAPGQGSEPYVGWHMSQQVAKYHEVWVLTRANNRTWIEAELLQKPIRNLHPVYLDLPRWAGFWKKGRRGIHLYYYLWQLAAYIKARRLHRQIGFDVVHHLTFGIDWIPSFLAFLPVPFVWGPIVGAQSPNRAFYGTFARRAKMQEYARSWARRLSRLDPLMRWAGRKTAVGLVSAAEEKEHLLRLGVRRVTVLPSVGISNCEIQKLSSLPRENGSGIVRFVCVGNLLAFKGISLGLEAFAGVRERCDNVELWVIGDGPERPSLVGQSCQLGLQHSVKFWGQLSRQELLTRLGECDVLLYLCLRGAISMACLEAMAAGLPVVCLDLGGSALQVSEESGFKVKSGSPQQVIEDLVEAMCLLAQNPDLRQRMGHAARQRVKSEFTWDLKGERISKIYCEARSAAG
jgi:glycosyltransferase involved in cell wall biosynthesis